MCTFRIGFLIMPMSVSVFIHVWGQTFFLLKSCPLPCLWMGGKVKVYFLVFYLVSHCAVLYMGWFTGANDDTLCLISNSVCSQPATSCSFPILSLGRWVLAWFNCFSLASWHPIMEMGLLFAVVMGASGSKGKSHGLISRGNLAERSHGEKPLPTSIHCL